MTRLESESTCFRAWSKRECNTRYYSIYASGLLWHIFEGEVVLASSLTDSIHVFPSSKSFSWPCKANGCCLQGLLYYCILPCSRCSNNLNAGHHLFVKQRRDISVSSPNCVFRQVHRHQAKYYRYVACFITVNADFSKRYSSFISSWFTSCLHMDNGKWENYIIWRPSIKNFTSCMRIKPSQQAFHRRL